MKQHIPNNYRTKECKNFYMDLYCSYGNRCQFYHSEKPDHLRPPEKESYLKSLAKIDRIFDELTRSDMQSLQDIDALENGAEFNRRVLSIVGSVVAD